MEHTDDWSLYQAGIDHKGKLDLFKNVDRNERFYAGHHWDGVDTGGLPQVRLNVTKRIVNWKVSQVMSDMLTMQFSAEQSAGNYDPNNPEKIKILQKVAADLSDYSKTTWERLKQDSLNEQALLDCALSGDGIVYFYWKDTIDAGNGVMGDIAEELIDNVNYFPGNTSDPRPNDKDGPLQPYIILAFRKQVEETKKEAKKNKISPGDISLIVSDSDTQYQAGDRAKQEPDKNKEGGKCTVLLKMWVKDGTIWARKSVRNAVIRKDWDTDLHRYPAAVMNWTPRKNSCHGEAEATELIPNNIAINKLMATMILWTMLLAWPKVIYDSNRIPVWSNDITKAIPCEGEITGAAQYLQSPGLPMGVQKLFDLLVQTTKDMAGANETALGDTSVTKTATGIIALQKASVLPLSMNKRRFAQFVEDFGLIWLDFWLTKYNIQRMLTVERTNPETRKTEKSQIPFDGSQYNQTTFSLKIDVGASTQWSEIASIQTLDNLLEKQLITFKQWLERIHTGLVPMKQELIDELEAIEAQADNTQILYKLMADYVQNLPPEVQSQLEVLRQTDPQGYEMQVKQMIMGGGQGGVSPVQSPANGGQQQVYQSAG